MILRLKILIAEASRLDPILNNIKKDGSLQKTFDEADKYRQKSLKSLKKLNNDKLTGALKDFALIF